MPLRKRVCPGICLVHGLRWQMAHKAFDLNIFVESDPSVSIKVIWNNQYKYVDDHSCKTEQSNSRPLRR